MMASVADPPFVESFFHQDTGTFTHAVHQGEGSGTAIIDAVLDYSPGCVRTSTESVDAILRWLDLHRLKVEWILETHAHADHLSAAAYLREVLGAPIGIGRGIICVQARFAGSPGFDAGFIADGRQFDRLFGDGDSLPIGQLTARVLATPGHTEDSVTYVVGDAAFVGDTVFAPDLGTARTDFPGGDAAHLYRSVRNILALPAATRIFLCHDYPPGGRPPMHETSVAAEAAHNIHVRPGIGEAEYVAVRRARDATLAAPRLLRPALWVNLRGASLPRAASGQGAGA
ncbi:MAG: MBL fold metallo-hydrolase, partial [Steroidobacteraceae bacterium]